MREEGSPLGCLGVEQTPKYCNCLCRAVVNSRLLRWLAVQAKWIYSEQGVFLASFFLSLSLSVSFSISLFVNYSSKRFTFHSVHILTFVELEKGRMST